MTSGSEPAARPRSEEFDQITMGWSQDNAEDLKARIELALEACAKNQNRIPTFAEDKVLKAMRKRLASF